MTTLFLPEKTQVIRIEDITVLEGKHRPFNEVQAQFYAMLLTNGRVFPPIAVRRTPNGVTKFTLVHGQHRLGGHRLAGLPEIQAQILKMDATTAAEASIEENLFRYELTMLDRIMAVADYRELFEERFGVIDPNGGRPKKLRHDGAVSQKLETDLLGNPIGSEDEDFYARVTARIGVSRRTAQRYCQIARTLHPDLRRALIGSTAEDDLATISNESKRSADEQASLARIIVRLEGDVGAALHELFKKPVQDTQSKARSALANGWERAQATSKAYFARTHIVKDAPHIGLLLADVIEGKITENEALDQLSRLGRDDA